MWGDTTNHFPKWPRPLEEILNWASRCRIWATKMKGKGGGKPPSLLNQLPFRPVKRIQVFGIVQPVWPGLNDDWWVILKVKGTAGIRLHNSWPLTQQQRLTFIPETATGKQQLRSPALAPTHTHCLWERMAHTEVWIDRGPQCSGDRTQWHQTSRASMESRDGEEEGGVKWGPGSCLRRQFLLSPADFCHMRKEKLIAARFSDFSGEAEKLNF